MKKIIFLIFAFFGLIANSQELPTQPANGFAFPIGSKFTIKLQPTDSIHFNYSIIAFESFQEVVDTFEHSTLFADSGAKDTIEFYFCLGTSGETETERKESMQVLLLMKNYSKYNLKYDSDIQREEEGEFEETSNVGTYSGALGTERWPYKILQIGLKSFTLIE